MARTRRATILIDTTRHLEAHTDDRIHRVAQAGRTAVRAAAGGSPATAADVVRAERRARNTDNGYWVAAAQAEAAHHALTGTAPLTDISRVALLTDGATRIVDTFGILDWHACLDIMDTAGPADLLAEVRRHEHDDADRTRWPRSKRHDDATAVYWHLTAL